jgi:hypothetical protein
VYKGSGHTLCANCSDELSGSKDFVAWPDYAKGPALIVMYPDQDKLDAFCDECGTYINEAYGDALLRRLDKRIKSGNWLGR